MARLLLASIVILAAAAGIVYASGEPPSSPGSVEVVDIPLGSSFADIVDSLAAHEIITRPTFFSAYAKLRGHDHEIKAGRYVLRQGTDWDDVLRDLTAGRVMTVDVTIPEGLTLPQIADRIAEVTERPTEEIQEVLVGDSAHLEWGLPGPGLEGFLFPDTYKFAQGVSLDQVIGAMVARYQDVWTPERRSALAATGYTEQEIMTLASIVQAEAARVDEMPTIAAVYRNRLDIGYPLQADPTVLYALGGHRERLLYAAMDSVADHPYNTYSIPGLPPGPIGAPGEAAIDAAITPADVEFLYFVARPDGTHIFTRTLAEHNRAVSQARAERAALDTTGMD